MTITTTDKAFAIARLIKNHGIDRSPRVVDDDIHYSLYVGHRQEGTGRDKKFVPKYEQRIITRYQVLGIYHDLYGE